MGKGRLAKVIQRQGKTEVTMEERKQRSLMEKTKRKIFEKMNENYDEKIAKARAHCLDRWRYMTGKGPDEAPD